MVPQKSITFCPFLLSFEMAPNTVELDALSVHSLTILRLIFVAPDCSYVWILCKFSLMEFSPGFSSSDWLFERLPCDDKRCYICGKHCHMSYHCTEETWCNYCRRTGHIEGNCKEKKRASSTPNPANNSPRLPPTPRSNRHVSRI